MKSLQKLIQRKMNKKGQVGLDTAKAVMLTLLTIGVIAFAIIIALASLKNSGSLTAGSTEKNQTDNILNNITAGTASFFSNTTTWFALLSVVVIILIIAIVIFAVNRFGGQQGGGL